MDLLESYIDSAQPKNANCLTKFQLVGVNLFRKTLLISLIGLPLAGCQVTAPVDPAKAETQAGAFPTNYRQIVLSDVKSSYFDPYSIRSAEITKPFLQNHAVLGHFWAVCVRANSKNRLGGYVGIQTNAYVFRHGALLQKSTHPEDYCMGAQYEPFPEMQSIN